MTDTTEDYEEMASLIGETVLKFINPLLISIDGYYEEEAVAEGQLLIGYVGTLTDFAREQIKENNPQWKLTMAASKECKHEFYPVKFVGKGETDLPDAEYLYIACAKCGGYRLLPAIWLG